MSPAHPLPTPEQVLQIAPALTDVVRPDWIDGNGHMNIRHYLDLGARATMVVCTGFGIDDEYRASRRLGVFTGEHHLTYLQELRLGSKISVHVRTLRRNDKVGHLMALIMDRENDRLACLFETVLVHVDLDTRRAADLPEDVAAAYDRAQLADQESAPWPAPVCGIMGPRGH